MIKSTMIKSSQAEKSVEKNGLKKKSVRFANDVSVDGTESLRSEISSKLDERDENIKRGTKYRNKFTSSEYTMNDFYDDGTTSTASSRAYATISSWKQQSPLLNVTTSTSDLVDEIDRTPLQLNLYVTRHQDFNNLYEFNESTATTTATTTTPTTTTTTTTTTTITTTTERGSIVKNETNNGSSTPNSNDDGSSINVVANPSFVDGDNEFMFIGDDEANSDNGDNFLDDGDDNGNDDKPRDSETSNLDESNFVRLYCNDKLFSRFGEGAYEQIISKKCTAYRPSYLTAFIIDDLNRLREKDPYVCLNYVILKEYLAMHGVPLTAMNDELI